MRSLPVLGLVMLLTTSGHAAPVGPGDQAPDFTLQDLSGASYKLSDFRGKVVLLSLVGYG